MVGKSGGAHQGANSYGKLGEVLASVNYPLTFQDRGLDRQNDLVDERDSFVGKSRPVFLTLEIEEARLVKKPGWFPGLSGFSRSRHF